MSNSYTVVPSSTHSKHTQPSWPAPNIRLVPVHSDQAFPTLQQLLILPSVHSSSPFIPALRPALRSLQLSVRSCSPFIPYDSLSVRFFHDLFIPYESLSVRIINRPFIPYESFLYLYGSLSVRIVIRTNRPPTVHVYLSFFVWSFLLALSRATDKIA